jgi:hypothetical protein
VAISLLSRQTLRMLLRLCGWVTRLVLRTWLRIRAGSQWFKNFSPSRLSFSWLCRNERTWMKSLFWLRLTGGGCVHRKRNETK